jgi:hypothetical protein
VAWKYRWWIVAVAAFLELTIPPAVVWTRGLQASPAPVLPPSFKQADFRGEPHAADVARIADWVATTGDNVSVGFVVIDKKQAKLFVFDENARLRSATAVLLGGAPGDDTVPGIGVRPLTDVKPEERTTPAGRFVAERGTNLRGEDVVWVSYEDGVSMHRVITTRPEERRLERLATPTPADNRISYGCINVPTAFFEEYVAPLFALYRAMVYILPESKTYEQVFTAPPIVANR